MADSADAVAVGSFTPFSEGRTVQGDAPEDVVSFAATTFVPTTVIKGAVPDEGVPMEFTLPVAPGESTSAIRQLNIDGPTGPVLVFLRRRPDGLWRQVSSLGIWASTERSPIDTPMSDEVAANGVFRDELAEVASLDQLAAYVSG